MAITADMVRRVTASANGSTSREDGERIVEIACLAVVADGRIAPEEIAVLRTFGQEIGPLGAAEIDELVRNASGLGTRDAQVERLRSVGDALSNDGARHLAYKVSVLTAMADLASSDAEFEFDIDLQDALHLSADIADRLAGEVHEAVTPDDE